MIGQRNSIHYQTEGTATAELITKTNNLDKKITEIMLAAEPTQCPKQHGR
jgi:hypothetical protein